MTIIGSMLLCGAVMRASEPSSLAVPPGKACYTEAQAKRGEAVYSVNCHGLSRPEAGRTDLGPPCHQGFHRRVEGHVVGDLFEKIYTSMPSNEPGKLTKEQVADSWPMF